MGKLTINIYGIIYGNNTYKSYYNIVPSSLYELINRSHVNTRLGTDHHKHIMPVINFTLNVYSFILLHANGTNC